MVAKIALLLACVCAIALADESAPTLSFMNENNGETGKAIQQAQQTIGDAANQVGAAGTAANQQQKLTSNNVYNKEKAAAAAAASASSKSNAQANAAAKPAAPAKKA